MKRASRSAMIWLAIAGLGATIFSGAPAIATADDPDLVLNLAESTVTQGDRDPLEITWLQDDPALGEGVATLTNGEPVRITRTAMIATPQSALRAPVEAVSAADVERAREYTDSIPRSLAGEDYVEGDHDVTQSSVEASAAIDPEELVPDSLLAITSTSVSASWAGSGVRHEVTRNGVLIASGDSPSFADKGLVAGEEVEYEITSYAEDGAVVESRMMPVTTPTGVANARMGARTHQAYVSQAIYRTFIDVNRVNLGLLETIGCGQAGHNDRTFGGDNRGFKTPPSNAPFDSTSYRTSFAMSISWDNPSPYDISWVKDVHPTKLYAGSTLLETRTASVDGIVVSGAKTTTSYGTAQVNHSVGNPFCAAGAITYQATFHLYRNGQFKVTGWRRPVPNHEIYGGWDNGNGTVTWRSMGTYSNNSFSCLAPEFSAPGADCGNKTISNTVTY